MTWFRNLIARTSQPRPAGRPRPACRPRLEALEDRQLLNASAVLDAAGNTFRLVVDKAGKLTETYLGQTTTLATAGVHRAHAYRDSDGSIGITVIYQNETAYDYDHTGGHYLGQNILDVDKAFDKAGHIQEDVTYRLDLFTYATIEYTSTAAYVVPQPDDTFPMLIHPFQDSQGNLGEDVSYYALKNGATTSTLVEYDAGGAQYMGQDAMADRAYGPSGGQFAYDVTYLSGVAVEYTKSSATLLGTDIEP
jgi:hypothetical protein